MKITSLLIFGVALTSCSSTPCLEGINILPRYGYKRKCAEQIKFDLEFLSECDARFTSRKEAARYYIGSGWELFNKKDMDTAMKRFNQAWLLDSTNAEVYSGFGNVLGMKRQFKSSIVELEKSLIIVPDNPKAWESISTSYSQEFFQTKNPVLLQKSIYALKKCVKLEPFNARAFGQLTGSYSYMIQKDSARKYLSITDKLNPNAVNPEVRRMLNSK